MNFIVGIINNLTSKISTTFFIFLKNSKLILYDSADRGHWMKEARVPDIVEEPWVMLTESVKVDHIYTVG